MSYVQLAEKIDCDPKYLNTIGLCRKNPGKHLAIIIEAATGGEVTAQELLDENYTRNYTRKIRKEKNEQH